MRVVFFLEVLILENPQDENPRDYTEMMKTVEMDAFPVGLRNVFLGLADTTAYAEIEEGCSWREGDNAFMFKGRTTITEQQAMLMPHDPSWARVPYIRRS